VIFIGVKLQQTVKHLSLLALFEQTTRRLLVPELPHIILYGQITTL